MSIRRFAICLLLVCARLASGDLQSEVERIVSGADLHHGNVGVCIIDTVTGEILVDIAASKGMIPASNQKLLTTGAALHVLGYSFEYHTKLIRSGNDLIVVGDGDPTLGDTELLGISKWASETAFLEAQLQPWIDACIKADIQSVETLYLDDRIFDQNFIHPSWPADQLNNWYCAQVAGINFHLNVVHFFPSPRKGTHANLGNIVPSMDWLTIKNKTTSRSGKKDRSTFWVARPPNTNQLTARGNVRSTHTEPVKVAFHDPPMVFGQTLASLLGRHGIAVQRVARVDPALVVEGATLYTYTTPLDLVLKRSNTDSHNLYAEALLKRLASFALTRQGTFDEGAQVVSNAVTQRLGSVQRGLLPVDGSGMSRKNLVSPMTLAKWLASFNLSDPTGKALLASLATPGEGTLQTRFRKVDLEGFTVHAKSGYISAVCALSGYIIPDNQEKLRTNTTVPATDKPHPLVFSIIVNGVKGTVKGAKNMQEAIVFAAFHSSK